MNNKKETLYSIGEVARMFDVSVATLRLYESEGLIISYKSKGNHRKYTDREIARLKCIRKMIEQEGLNLAGIRMMLSAIPCWEIKDCPPEVRETCDAYTSNTGPCWKMEVKGEICSEADCHLCTVYQQSSECTDLKNILNTYWKVRKNGHENEQA